MAFIAQLPELQQDRVPQGDEQGGSATEKFLAEFDDVAGDTFHEDEHAGISSDNGTRNTSSRGDRSTKPRYRMRKIGENKLTEDMQQGVEEQSAAGREQQQSERKDGSGPYGWSPSSCNRHLRKRRRSKVSCASKDNKPKALVDGEMEIALAGGSRVAETAMRAVRQANAQVCLANLEVCRTCGVLYTRGYLL